MHLIADCRMKATTVVVGFGEINHGILGVDPGRKALAKVHLFALASALTMMSAVIRSASDQPITMRVLRSIVVERQSQV